MRLIAYLCLLLTLAPPLAAAPAHAAGSDDADVAAAQGDATSWHAEGADDATLRRQTQRRAPAILALLMLAPPLAAVARALPARYVPHVPAPHLVRTPPLLC